MENIPANNLFNLDFEPVVKADGLELIIHLNNFSIGPVQIIIEGRVVKVKGYQEDTNNNSEFAIRKFTKIFEIPRAFDITKLTKYLKSPGIYIVEVPFANT